jgi:hypothetical protein
MKSLQKRKSVRILHCSKMIIMKYLFIVITVLLVAEVNAQENYVVRLGDKTYSVSMDSIYQVLVDGKKMNLSLRQKDTLLFRDSLFSFSYLKDYHYTKTNIENAADQYTIITASGAGYMIQKYTTINPKREDYQRKLKSGQAINVIKAVLTYKDDVDIYEVASIGGKDEGILVITIDNNLEQSAPGRDLIKLLWDSLTYSTK